MLLGAAGSQRSSSRKLNDEAPATMMIEIQIGMSQPIGHWLEAGAAPQRQLPSRSDTRRSIAANPNPTLQVRFEAGFAPAYRI
jgi:hypothetical protein